MHSPGHYDRFGYYNNVCWFAERWWTNQLYSIQQKHVMDAHVAYLPEKLAKSRRHHRVEKVWEASGSNTFSAWTKVHVFFFCSSSLCLQWINSLLEQYNFSCPRPRPLVIQVEMCVEIGTEWHRTFLLLPRRPVSSWWFGVRKINSPNVTVSECCPFVFRLTDSKFAHCDQVLFCLQLKLLLLLVWIEWFACCLFACSAAAQWMI